MCRVEILTELRGLPEIKGWVQFHSNRPGKWNQLTSQVRSNDCHQQETSTL